MIFFIYFQCETWFEFSTIFPSNEETIIMLIVRASFQSNPSIFEAATIHCVGNTRLTWNTWNIIRLDLIMHLLRAHISSFKYLRIPPIYLNLGHCYDTTCCTMKIAYLYNSMILTSLKLSSHGFVFCIYPKDFISIKIFFHFINLWSSLYIFSMWYCGWISNRRREIHGAEVARDAPSFTHLLFFDDSFHFFR